MIEGAFSMLLLVAGRDVGPMREHDAEKAWAT
jgi:hypothetical protein